MIDACLSIVASCLPSIALGATEGAKVEAAAKSVERAKICSWFRRKGWSFSSQRKFIMTLSVTKCLCNDDLLK